MSQSIVENNRAVSQQLVEAWLLRYKHRQIASQRGQRKKSKSPANIIALPVCVPRPPPLRGNTRGCIWRRKETSLAEFCYVTKQIKLQQSQRAGKSGSLLNDDMQQSRKVWPIRRRKEREATELPLRGPKCQMSKKDFKVTTIRIRKMLQIHSQT